MCCEHMRPTYREARHLFIGGKFASFSYKAKQITGPWLISVIYISCPDIN